MNKKQLTVAWVVGILTILSIIFPYTIITDYIDAYPTFRKYAWVQIIVILIIGGLLIYALRGKREK